MKKILSLGVASAICALTAISASAAPASFDQKGEIKKDSVITIDVKAGQDVTGFACKVETTGLEVQSVANPTAGLAQNAYFAAQKMFTLSNGKGVVVAKAGEVICTITAKVTAEAGQEISVALVDTSADGKYTAFLPDAPFKATVKGAEESKPAAESSTPAAESSTPAAESSTPAAESSTPATESKPESKPAGEQKPGNPGTGVALAVVPAVLAAAGVVVAKKRK